MIRRNSIPSVPKVSIRERCNVYDVKGNFLINEVWHVIFASNGIRELFAISYDMTSENLISNIFNV